MQTPQAKLIPDTSDHASGAWEQNLTQSKVLDDLALEVI